MGLRPALLDKQTGAPRKRRAGHPVLLKPPAFFHVFPPPKMGGIPAIQSAGANPDDGECGCLLVKNQPTRGNPSDPGDAGKIRV